MKKYLFLFFTTLLLFAENPNSFAALGDVIFDNVDTFEKLESLPVMAPYYKETSAYIREAKRVKKMGFALDAKEDGVVPKEYLAALRKLSAQHDKVIQLSRNTFKEAIENEDTTTVNYMVVNGIIDPENYRSELINFYEEFGEDNNLSGIELMYEVYVEATTDDSNVTRESQAAREAREKRENIKRFEATLKARDKALEESVAEEKTREKEKVLATQKEELGL